MITFALWCLAGLALASGNVGWAVLIFIFWVVFV